MIDLSELELGDAIEVPGIFTPLTQRPTILTLEKSEKVADLIKSRFGVHYLDVFLGHATASMGTDKDVTWVWEG